MGFVGAVALGVLVSGTASADTFVSLPDGQKLGPGLTVTRTAEHALISPSMAANGCLSDAQINAIVAADAPMKLNYPLASGVVPPLMSSAGGETEYPGHPFLSGLNLLTPESIVGAQPPANPLPNGAAAEAKYWEVFVRDFLAKDPNFNALTVDPQNPGPWQQRINELSILGQDLGMEGMANKTDFTDFAKAGGKLLLIQGKSDASVSYRETIEYYNQVQATMGSAAVHDFARFYLIPGFDHWNRPAFNVKWDWISALENWVENGRPPQSQVATDSNPATAGRSRPLCECPTWPKYNGTGDVNQASNFTCVT
ncbi:tannase/feruloyl esterase family alpha/beta hydrolase [Rhodococcus qingshengii]|uniref:tannase/feruloyl esterase family alpha/beta hydrolase n=1 Tax=Rhodococcus qingshengii TaxID=334542 RepID=UPI0007E56A1A